MPLFLIPVAAVGYKIWEHQKKKNSEEEQNEETGEPSRVVDALPSDSANKLQTQDSNVTKDTTDETLELDHLDSNLSTDDDDQTRSTVNEEQAGGLFGIRKFFEDKIDEHRARELQKQKNRELAMKIARGEVPVALPKISYK